jgi:poly-beta-1,6-N-acetyl-D-glucosamine synthase
MNKKEKENVNMNMCIISPVRDEASHIYQYLKAVMPQLTISDLWIVVDDGSTDETYNILEKYKKEKFERLHLVKVANRGFRNPGGGVIEAFYYGLNNIDINRFDIIVKLDADLEIPDNMFSEIKEAFAKDPNLGITGATIWELPFNQQCGEIRPRIVPEDFVGGPDKFYRRKCFQEIGGLSKRSGWDGVDTIKANMLGWTTKELLQLKVVHRRPTGLSTQEGVKYACRKYGSVSYYMGGYVWYFLIRCFARAIQSKNIMVAWFMLEGYLNSLKNKETQEGIKFRKYLKKVQRKRFVYWVRKALQHG